MLTFPFAVKPDTMDRGPLGRTDAENKLIRDMPSLKAAIDKAGSVMGENNLFELLLPALIKERYQSFSPAQSKYEVLSLVSRDCCVSESTTP